MQQQPKEPVPPQLVMEQYKAKLTDLGNLGARQLAMTTYYVSIVSALFGVLAFKDRPLSAIDPFVIALVGVGGLLVSILWLFGVTFFRQLFRAKLHMLETIEEALPFQTFKPEYEQTRLGGSASWLWIERFVPAVFATLFLSLLGARFL
jgi:hypothetical protein